MGNQHANSASNKITIFDHEFLIENFSKYTFDHHSSGSSKYGLKKHAPSIISINIAPSKLLLSNKLECYFEALPVGESEATENFVGAFLHFTNHSKSRIYIHYSISLMEKDKLYLTKEGSGQIEMAGRFGWSNFISRKFLLKNCHRFLPNDKLIIRCEVVVSKKPI